MTFISVDNEDIAQFQFTRFEFNFRFEMESKLSNF